VKLKQLHLYKKGKKIRTSILSGDITAAIKVLNENYPGLLETDKKANFLLSCQQFVELIKQNQVGPAIDYAQKVLSSFNQLDESDEKYLQDVLGLLAYSNPLLSPVGYLLSIQQRELAADRVNELMLGVENQNQTRSSLEIVLKHLISLQHTLREGTGNKGEIFQLESYS